MRHTWFFKAYMYDLNTQMIVTPKMDKVAKKYIFLGKVEKVGVGCFVQIPKAS